MKVGRQEAVDRMAALAVRFDDAHKQAIERANATAPGDSAFSAYKTMAGVCLAAATVLNVIAASLEAGELGEL